MINPLLLLTSSLFITFLDQTSATVSLRQNPSNLNWRNVQSYGQRCNFTLTCDSLADLTCFSGRCKCTRPGDMLWDQDQQRCVSRAGQICFYWTLKHWDDYLSRRRSGIESATVTTIRPDCVPNAYCNEEGRCACEAGFYEAANGTCLVTVRHLDPCQYDSQCQKMGHVGSKFVCVDGKCRCDSKVSTFETIVQPMAGHAKVDACVGKAGSPCVNGLCTHRAICLRSSTTCECQHGSIETASGHCKNVHSTHCETAQDCAHDLVCKDKRCACQYADQLYDAAQRRCLSRAGEPCNSSLTFGSTNCVKNARCQPINEEGPSHCLCEVGFVENTAGDCKASYGGSCDLNSECDATATLACLNNICRCNDFARFDTKKGKCVGLVGAKCGSLPWSKDCVENAVCRSSHPRLPGHCVCKPGFVEDSNYACIPPPNSS